MIKVNYDRTQVAAVVGLLATLREEAEGEAVELPKAADALVTAIEQAVSENAHETDPYEVQLGIVSIVVWPLPAKEVANYGHTHEVSLFVNPVVSLRQEGVSPVYDVISVKVADNDPRRLRYIHVRRYVSHFYGQTLLGEELQLNGGFTVCFRDNLDGTLTYGIAKCRSDENYVRKLGREKSELHLVTNPKTVTMSINEFRPWVLGQIEAGNWK